MKPEVGHANFAITGWRLSRPAPHGAYKYIYFNHCLLETPTHSHSSFILCGVIIITSIIIIYYNNLLLFIYLFIIIYLFRYFVAYVYELVSCPYPYMCVYAAYFIYV